MMNNNDELKFVEKLSEYVISRLSGKHDDYNEFKTDSYPSREIILGTLCPKPDVEKLVRSSSSVETNALSVSFLLKNFKEIRVKPKFSVYLSKEKTLEDNQKIGKTFKKYGVPTKEYLLTSIQKNKSINFEGLNDKLIKDVKTNKKIKEVWSAKLLLEVREYNQEGEKLQLITITLENTTEKDEENKFMELSLFDVSLEIYLESKIKPFIYTYNYGGYPESYPINLQCTNCSGEYYPSENKIVTNIFKKFYQKKIEPNNNLITLDGKEKKLLFSELIDEGKRDVFLEEIFSEMKNYENHYKKNTPNNSSKDYEKYIDYLKKFRAIMSRFGEGIELLKKDYHHSSKAFKYLQETFKNASEYSGWRLFQLIFIISQISDIINENNLDTTEVLHVDTGGGKSEAYFGLVIFASFLHRLNGKRFGVTGITKFPLRMLSIQQLQRVANLFIWAEVVRKKGKIYGERFSLAYFVGNSKEFPKNNYEIVESLKTDKIMGRIIIKCPLCKGEGKGKIYLHHHTEDNTVTHRCESCKEEFFLYFSDDEIYRKLPTFIIATVDKFARVCDTREFRNLFGGKISECPKGHGFITLGDICRVKDCEENGKNIKINFNTGPLLIIQDEMHLIREGFGTIDSHFEYFIETLQKEFQGKGFKNIAMTATISGASNQIHQLYKKRVQIFPGISPLGKGVCDFFFTLKDETQRILLGLKPNVRDNNYAIRKTLDHILKFISEVEKDKNKFCKENNFDKIVLDELLTFYKSYLSYYQKKDHTQTTSFFSQYELDEKLSKGIDNYRLKAIVLTGEQSLDRIREIISEIESQDTLNTKELFNTCATSVVSHGVDIEKWNVMFFQGMPRSTAEYIQSSSRAGRKHLGLIFVWFYPNRVRDLSFFNKFEEYHNILNHHVKPVPLLRGAKLGFHQTFNSLFCAAIINYFSNKFSLPIYNVSEVNKIFSENEDFKKNREDLINFLKVAYGVSLEKDNYFEENIAKEVESRLNKLSNYKGNNKYFFPNALKESNDPYFKNQMGMRGIQSEIILKPDYEEEGFISNFKKNSRREIK